MILSEFEEIKVASRDNFTSLYSNSKEAEPSSIYSMLENIPNLVTKEENSDLMKPISESEISQAIWSLEPEKAFNPDSLSVSFYRSFWDTIKTDLKIMLRYVHHSLRIGANTNSSFLALIPKETNPTSFSQFRPISLCNLSYKILTKIIANLLKKVLPKLIFSKQGGFMQDRQIVDNKPYFKRRYTQAIAQKEKLWLSNWIWQMLLIVFDTPFFFRIWNALDLVKIS